MAKSIAKPSTNAGAPLVVAQDKAPSHPSGEFVGTIAEAVTVTASTGETQIQLSIETEAGKITHWMNLKGFKRWDELSPTEQKRLKPCQIENEVFASLDGTAAGRIEDPARTEKAREIVGRALSHAGTPDGTEFNSIGEICDALRGAEIGIHVERTNGYARVKYTLRPSDVEVEA